MADLVPERAIEISFGGQFLTMRRSDSRLPALARASEQIRVSHDVRAQQDGAPVASGQIAFVGKNRRSVAATRLPEISHDVIDADGNVFSHLLVMLVRQ